MNKRDIKSLHYISGILITIFIGLHLFNHAYAILGVEKHVVLMSALRKIYRNPYVEPLLLGAVVVQANLILMLGTIVVIVILLGQTNFFMGVSFPSEYIKLVKSFL